MPTETYRRPPIALSLAEVDVARALTRIGTFHVFLREVHAALFDEAFRLTR